MQLNLLNMNLRFWSWLAAAVAVLALLPGCGKTAGAGAPVFVKDDVGIVRRVNPDEKNVYLVFTAHFSENDNGYSRISTASCLF